MESSQSNPSDGEIPLAEAIERRLLGIDSGNYRATTKTALEAFATWLSDERGVETVGNVSVLDCRRYAQHLSQRVRNDDDPLGGASAHEQGPYFSSVRAFFSWAIDEEWVDQNPTRPNRVTNELPEYHDDPDRQFWDSKTREEMLRYVDAQARQALEDGTIAQRRRAYRDRAIVTLLAFTGMRSAELFADSRDDERNGLRWADVDLEAGVATVFGKIRKLQEVALPDRAVKVLDRYKRQLDPASDSWPVIYSGGHRTLRESAEQQLVEAGWSEEDRKALLTESTKLDPFYREGLCPPPLTKSGGRAVMKRLSENAGVEIDGEYLKPHGGRRALGSQLYEADAELAQETLRHESIKTTKKAYRKADAKDRAARIDETLSE